MNKREGRKERTERRKGGRRQGMINEREEVGRKNEREETSC